MTASAAKVYRCPDASGGVVFSDVPCGAGATRVDLSAASASVPGSRPDPIHSPASAAPLAPPPEFVEPPPAAPPRPGDDWAAFKCSTAHGMVFYRYAHCPKTIAITHYETVGDVERVHAEEMAVAERGVTLPTACDALYGRSAAKRWGREYDEPNLPPEERSTAKDPCH